MVNGRSVNVVVRWHTALIGLVVVVGFAFVAPRVFAFTEPTDAPPGGNAISAPLNVSTTEQTKPGRLNLSGTYAAGLIPALTVGTAAVPKQICWNDDGTGSNCLDSWQDLLGTGYVHLRPVLESTSFPLAPNFDFSVNFRDPGHLTVAAQEAAERWAILGQASPGNPRGTLITPSYGLVGLTHIDSDKNVGIFAFDLGLPNSYAAQFWGRTVFHRGDGTAGDVANAVSVYAKTNAALTVNDAISVHADTLGSGVYAQQINAAASAYAGYFSGRVGVNLPNDVESGVTIQRNPIGPNAGDYKYLSFAPGGTDAWRFRVYSKNTPHKPYLLINSFDGAEHNILTLDPGDLSDTQGSLSIGGMVQTNPRLLVNKFSGSSGSVNDAVGVYMDSSRGGTVNPTQGSALYVEQQSNDPDVYTAYFSGPRTNVNGSICLNDPGNHSTCISSWPASGPGANLWDRTAANVVHPLTVGDKFALGGIDATAPLYFDPTTASMALNSGTLYANSGTLSIGIPGSGGGGDSGCFLAGTPVTMADGSTKAIEDIAVGDLVLAYDDVAKTTKASVVTAVYHHPPEELYLVVNGELKVTPIHRVLSAGKWVRIGSLKVGDTLTDASGNAVLIRSIETVRESAPVYNLAVATYHTYIAGGFIVHNKKDAGEWGMEGTGTSRNVATRISSRVASVFSSHIPAAQAGMVTNPNGPPENRIVVKNGVIGIDNTSAGGSKFEIGNAGRDIASSGELFLRPSGLDSTHGLKLEPIIGNTKMSAGYLNLSAASVAAAPIISAVDTGSATTAIIQNMSGTQNAPTMVVVNSNNAAQPSGHALEALATGAGNVASALYAFNSSAAGYAGYFSGRTYISDKLGINQLAPNARLVINAGLNDQPGSTDDAVGIYANTAASALYAYQANAAAGAYAGYFQGRTHVQGELHVGTSAFPIGTNDSIQGFNNATATAYNAVAGYKSGANTRGSAVYGELVGGASCAAGQTCAAIYGSDGISGTNTWAGYFSGRIFTDSGLIVDEGATGLGAKNPPDPSTNGLQVRGGLNSFGDANAARGHRFTLGGASNSAGLEWRYYEAEDWQAQAYDPDCFGIYLANNASGGRALKVNASSASCTVGGATSQYATVHATSPGPGSYLMVIRAVGPVGGTAKLRFGFTSSFVGPGYNNNARELTAADFTQANTWQTFAFRFNSPGGTISPIIELTAAGAGEFDVDWVSIVPDIPANAPLGQTVY